MENSASAGVDRLRCRLEPLPRELSPSCSLPFWWRRSAHRNIRSTYCTRMFGQELGGCKYCRGQEEEG